MFKLLLDRDPLTGEDLASQPTLSRFENWVSSTELYAMGMAMSKKVVAYHKKRLGRRRVRRVTIDMDPTDTATYGGQQLTFFNAHYGHYCYLPMLGFLTFNDEPEQYLFAAMLRSGTTPASQGAIALLRRIIAQVRKAFPKAKLRIVYKAEVPRLEGREPRDNPRFVVTNMRYKPETVYQIYRMRGESENRIKELLIGLELDRMSCNSFKANQLRILLTAAAYMLIQTFRCRLSRTRLGRRQVDSLRLMVLKVGAKISRSVRRYIVSMAENHPWREEWIMAARAWGAVVT